jgi:hypothetical protein
MAQAAKTTKETKTAKGRRPPDENERDPKPKAERETDREPSPPTGEDAAPVGGPHVCDVAFCPIGLALTAVEQVQPDVVSHLLLAGREFFLAAKAVMDARAEDLGRDAAPEGRARMERIDIG